MGSRRSVECPIPGLVRSFFMGQLNIVAVSRAFAMHAACALIASILIALDIVAAARSMADLDITAPDIVSIEP
jgi:hypothetical protein